MGSIGVGATLTAGIQDIAALLPLLSTDQCEDHVGSALTKGYLYSVATPLSIFGSLGMARAGLKTFLACADVPKYKIVGAHWLANMGFRPQGTNLPLIMMDAESDHNHNGGGYLVQRRVDEMIEELHIDRSRITNVSHACAVWNIKMMAFTAVACLLSITPYIYINIKGDSSTLSYAARWVFPVVRALGGFLTATMIQLVMQIRIVVLTKRHLGLTKFNRNESPIDQRDSVDAEKRLGEKKALRSESGDVDDASGDSFLTWVLLALLLCGVLALVVGYIGCFSIVQGTTMGAAGPISWLCLEAGLSMLRLILWGLNPTFDDAPDMEIDLELDQHAPVATCMKDDEMIAMEQVLPLMRASEFLTSSVGLIRRFAHPDLTLYYTLTRKQSTIDGRTVTHNERILYVTIFDHKERTARMYTRDANAQDVNEPDKFFSAGELSLDVEHDQLETTLGGPIVRMNDPVVSNDEIWEMLKAHYQSIVTRLCSDWPVMGYGLVNKWTMKAMDTVSRLNSQRQQEHVKAGAPGVSSLEADQRLLQLALLEKKRRSLLDSRGEWNENYMRWVMEELEDLPRRVDSSEANACQIGALYARAILFREAHEMEMLLVKEVEGWEERLLERMQKISDGLDDARKRQLARVWSQSCWRRLDGERRQMRVRISKLNEWRLENQHADERTQRKVCQEWESIVQRYAASPWFLPSSRPLSSVAVLAKKSSLHRLNLSRLDRHIPGEVLVWVERLWKDMWKRLIREGEEIDQRLASGLERCDQFGRPDRTLFKVRHFPSDYLYLRHDEVLDTYLQELKRSRDVVAIDCSSMKVQEAKKVSDAIRTMPWVTSMVVFGLKDPYIVDLSSIEGNIHLLSITGNCHLNQKIQEILARNQSISDKTFIARGVLNLETTVSFVGPQSGTVTLRLVHCSDSATTITIRGPSPSEPLLSVRIPTSLTVDDITLHPSPSEKLSFHPGARNTFTITSEPPYHLRDIYILDSVGNPHNSPLDSPPFAISCRTVSAGDQLDVGKHRWKVLDLLGSY